MSSSPIHNLPLTNTVEISDIDDIQSVIPSLSKNVGKEVFTQSLDFYQYNFEEVHIRIDQVKSPKFPSCDAP